MKGELSKVKAGSTLRAPIDGNFVDFPRVGHPFVISNWQPLRTDNGENFRVVNTSPVTSVEHPEEKEWIFHTESGSVYSLKEKW